VYAVRTSHDSNADPNRATSQLKRTANSPSHHCEFTSQTPPCQYAMRTLARMRSTAGWFRASGAGTYSFSGTPSWFANTPSAYRREPVFNASRKGNPSNVRPIFHLTPSGGATCGSLNVKTILGAPYPKRRDGLCHMDHRMLSGRLNDRVYVGGSDEAPI